MTHHKFMYIYALLIYIIDFIVCDVRMFDTSVNSEMFCFSSLISEEIYFVVLHFIFN